MPLSPPSNAREISSAMGLLVKLVCQRLNIEGDDSLSINSMF